jgi:hypothetical protein
VEVHIDTGDVENDEGTCFTQVTRALRVKLTGQVDATISTSCFWESML